MRQFHFDSIIKSFMLIFIVDLVPFNSVSNQDVNVKQGEAVIIPIPPVDSYPDAVVSWYQGSTAIPQETQRYQVTLDNNLVILATSQNDHGNAFTATAVNNYIGVSSSTQQFVLKVQSKF